MPLDEIVAKLLRRLVYRSTALIHPEDDEARDRLFRISVKNNRRNGITGCLAQPDGHFVQVIEGSDSKVDELWSRLQTDTRHSESRHSGELECLSPFVHRLGYGAA